jgi:hypothetical protein
MEVEISARCTDGGSGSIYSAQFTIDTLYKNAEPIEDVLILGSLLLEKPGRVRVRFRNKKTRAKRVMDFSYFPYASSD